MQQLDVACETKSHDNVFVQIVVSVQYQVRALKRKQPGIHRSLQDASEHRQDVLYALRFIAASCLLIVTSNPGGELPACRRLYDTVHMRQAVCRAARIRNVSRGA